MTVCIKHDKYKGFMSRILLFIQTVDHGLFSNEMQFLNS